jgi:hypothetical protein
MRISPIFALSLLGTLLGGCSEWVGELWYKGTTKGVAMCEAKGAGQNLNKSTVRNICVRKHQKSVPDSLEGKAGYRAIWQGLSFQGYMTNKSTDVVITKYSVWVSHHSVPWRTEITFEDKWIEPGNGESFTIEKDQLTYQPQNEEEKKANNLIGVRTKCLV